MQFWLFMCPLSIAHNTQDTHRGGDFWTRGQSPLLALMFPGGGGRAVSAAEPEWEGGGHFALNSIACCSIQLEMGTVIESVRGCRVGVGELCIHNEPRDTDALGFALSLAPGSCSSSVGAACAVVTALGSSRLRWGLLVSAEPLLSFTSGPKCQWGNGSVDFQPCRSVLVLSYQSRNAEVASEEPAGSAVVQAGDLLARGWGRPRRVWWGRAL